jgi:4,5-DOPA dioxygenase extradiol
MLHYRQQHPDARQTQPRSQHLLPLFTALRATGPMARAWAIHRGIGDHVIAMDSYTFERAARAPSLSGPAAAGLAPGLSSLGPS